MKHYEGSVTIELDETRGNHQYAVTDPEKGLVNATMRGVTDIKRQIIAKPGLILWPMDMALKYLKENVQGTPTDEDYEEAARAHRKRSDFGKDIGTEVHKAIEQYLEGEASVMPEQEAGKAFMAFTKWYEKNDIETGLVEEVVYSREYQYCGKFDALLEIEDKQVLVDFKTTNVSAYALKKGKLWTGLYPEDFMQLGFYSKAYTEATGNKLDDLMLVNCTKDGKVITLTASEIGWSVGDCENLAISALNISDGLKKIKKSALEVEDG